jgi:hypothetical protein
MHSTGWRFSRRRACSELRELWEDDEEWKQEVDGLYARLQ